MSRKRQFTSMTNLELNRTRCPSCLKEETLKRMARYTKYIKDLIEDEYDDDGRIDGYEYDVGRVDYRIMRCEDCTQVHFQTEDYYDDTDENFQHLRFHGELNLEPVFCLDQTLLSDLPDNVRTICLQTMQIAKQNATDDILLILAMAFRAILDAVCKAKSITDTKNITDNQQDLAKKLQLLYDSLNQDEDLKIADLKSLIDQMHLIRFVGNDAAHMNEHYLEITPETLSSIASMISTLLGLIFGHPAELERMRVHQRNASKSVVEMTFTYSSFNNYKKNKSVNNQSSNQSNNQSKSRKGKKGEKHKSVSS